MTRKMLRLLMPFLALLIALGISYPPAYAGDIVVKPGKFDHFLASIPDRITAGEENIIKLQAVDVLNNPIVNFGDNLKEFSISVSGSASVKPSIFSSARIEGSYLSLALSDKTAEKISFSIRESGKNTPLMSKEITVVPGRLNSFILKTPKTSVAGERFDVRVTAIDQYGNTSQEPILGKSLNLSLDKGDAELKQVGSVIPDFKNGVCIFSLVSEKTGSSVIELKDMVSGISGVSERVAIVNGPLHAFKIIAPNDVLAGEPFEVSFIALDRYGNMAANYSTLGNGVSIKSTGRLKIFPAFIPAYDFVNGQAKLEMRYDAQEDIVITMTESGKQLSGRSSIIKVVSPTPEKYDITTPESAIAGQKFKIKVTAFNQLGNVIRNYNLVGPDVELQTTGTGNLLPTRVPASEFINGTAIVEAQYDKSEAFSIEATPAKGISTSPAKPKTRNTVHQSKKTKRKSSEQGSGTGQVSASTQKTAQEITAVSYSEKDGKASIVIDIRNMDNRKKYAAYTEKIDGKTWIVVRISSALNKVGKSLKLNTSLIANTVIDEDPKDQSTVLVRFEQTKPFGFHMEKDKNSLIILIKK